MNKVLIVTYYWPPAGGVAVQRWLKFSHYLVRNGIEVVVFTAGQAAYPMIDHELEEQVLPEIEIHRIPVIEPREWLKNIFKKEKLETENRKDNLDRLFFIPKDELSLKQKMILWIRANIFIPDARVLWVNPVIKAITRYLKGHPNVDFIITTGPPHSVHLIGRGIKKRHHIKWISDFRDPWLEIEYFDLMPLTKWAFKKHKRLEKGVVEESDGVTIVSPFWKKIFSRYNQKSIRIITNGYDIPDFQVASIPEENKFVLVHMGTLQLDRNAPELWQAIQELNEEFPEFKEKFALHIYGNIDDSISKDLFNYGIEAQVIKKGFVPHRIAVQKMKSATMLLLLINRNLKNAPGRMTSKIFEYLAAKKPILFLGLSQSDPAELIRQTNAGIVSEFDDYEGLKRELKSAFLDYFESGLQSRSVDIEQYSREHLTQKLIEFMNQLKT